MVDFVAGEGRVLLNELVVDLHQNVIVEQECLLVVAGSLI